MRHIHWKILSCIITHLPPPFAILLWPTINRIKIRTDEPPQRAGFKPFTYSLRYFFLLREPPTTDIKSGATTTDSKAETLDSMKTATKRKKKEYKKMRGSCSRRFFFKSLSSINFDNIVQHAAKCGNYIAVKITLDCWANTRLNLPHFTITEAHTTY